MAEISIRRPHIHPFQAVGTDTGVEAARVSGWLVRDAGSTSGVRYVEPDEFEESYGAAERRSIPLPTVTQTEREPYFKRGLGGLRRGTCASFGQHIALTRQLPPYASSKTVAPPTFGTPTQLP
jgi:hypothetical protein